MNFQRARDKEIELEREILPRNRACAPFRYRELYFRARLVKFTIFDYFTSYFHSILLVFCEQKGSMSKMACHDLLLLLLLLLKRVFGASKNQNS